VATAENSRDFISTDTGAEPELSTIRIQEWSWNNYKLLGRFMWFQRQMCPLAGETKDFRWVWFCVMSKERGR
jgi:hypothetical protein